MKPIASHYYSHPLASSRRLRHRKPPSPTSELRSLPTEAIAPLDELLEPRNVAPRGYKHCAANTELLLSEPSCQSSLQPLTTAPVALFPKPSVSRYDRSIPSEASSFDGTLHPKPASSQSTSLLVHLSLKLTLRRLDRASSLHLEPRAGTACNDRRWNSQSGESQSFLPIQLFNARPSGHDRSGIHRFEEVMLQSGFNPQDLFWIRSVGWFLNS